MRVKRMIQLKRRNNLSETQFWDEKHLESISTRNLKFKNKMNYEEYFSVFPHFKYVAEFFGRIKGKKILDLGCGTGWVSIYFARSGAEVFSCDISPEAINIAKKMAISNSVKIKAEVMEAEKLSYEDDMFDFIFGNAILYHTKIELSTKEIYRVLKKGGKAAFIEPLAGNPFRRVYRKIFHPDYRSQGLLTYDDIKIFGTPFRKVDWREFYLFNWFYKYRKSSLEKIDSKVLDLLPWFRKWCRIVVIRAIK
ncbi:MAG: hypothetical protein DRN92_02910 [Thermoproteota archaeon]|nr:MAG: hypothetical protein DRN92_02910 [Candidatus Korarchaeota archaeon]